MATEFKLLDDQPNAGPQDPLGFGVLAETLVDLLKRSRGSTPLVLGIESDWGRGKSTLMRYLEGSMASDQNVTTVWFNAWTSTQGDALEGLVKSVLDKLDKNILRRIARKRRVLNWAKVALSLLAGWLQVGSVVDALWRRIEIDPKSRNEIARLVEESVKEWAEARGEIAANRLLVVFVDDLDRCHPIDVMQVFAAIKLYLNAPGLIFIVGYDRSVVTDAILEQKQYTNTGNGNRYLEKIVQIVYRLPDIDLSIAERLLITFLDASGTAELFDPPLRSLTIEQNARNPRRIKRFLNGFVLEYRLDAEWAQPELGPAALVRVLVIDVYFPEFGALLRSRSSRDPIRDFREYVALRHELRATTMLESAGNIRSLLDSFFDDRQLGYLPADIDPAIALERIDREVPPTFLDLAGNSDFLSLLDGFGNVERVREKMRRYEVNNTVPSLRREYGEQAGPIFLSYSRARMLEARSLKEVLEKRFGPTSVLLDVGGPMARDDWFSALSAAIQSSSVVVAIVGSESIPSFMEEELALAIDNPHVVVLPVLVDPEAGLDTDSLPERLKSLAYLQAFSLPSLSDQHQLELLLDTIEQHRLRSGRLHVQEAMQRSASQIPEPDVEAVLKVRRAATTDTLRNVR